jgi:hypothetical protein
MRVRRNDGPASFFVLSQSFVTLVCSASFLIDWHTPLTDHTPGAFVLALKFLISEQRDQFRQSGDGLGFLLICQTAKRGKTYAKGLKSRNEVGLGKKMQLSAYFLCTFSSIRGKSCAITRCEKNFHLFGCLAKHTL